MKLARRSRGGAVIPTASMSDIAFLLLLFFMVTTVFVTARGMPEVIVPKAEATDRIRLRSSVSTVLVDSQGTVFIDGWKPRDMASFAAKIVEKKDENIKRGRKLVVFLRVDQSANYGLVDQLLEKLQEVEALQVTFATEEEAQEAI